MSQQQIQPTNLPIYLQNYTVDILDGKKEPKKMGDVFYSTVGAIPSNVPESQSMANELNWDTTSY